MPTPRPTPTPVTTRANTGLSRIESADGGWSLEYPDGWWPFNAGFGGATLATRDPELGIVTTVQPPNWMWSAPGVRVELWANAERLSASEYADKHFKGGGWWSLVSREPATIAGQSGVVVARNEGHQPPDDRILVQRYWIVPTLRADRMLVIATSDGSPYMSAVDRLVSSLRLFEPRTTRGAPDITREQVLARWTSGKSPAPRAEAKLVPYAEAPADGRGNGLQRLDRDPEMLVWVVAVSAQGAPPGFVLPVGRGGLGGTPPPTRWTVSVTPAYSTDPGNMLWTQYGSNDDWPPYFDKLKDRCC